MPGLHWDYAWITLGLHLVYMGRLLKITDLYEQNQDYRLRK